MSCGYFHAVHNNLHLGAARLSGRQPVKAHSSITFVQFFNDLAFARMHLTPLPKALQGVLIMSQPQRQTLAPKRRRRRCFVAAVRFADGSHKGFTVDNAHDHDDARRMVLEELADVAAVVIASRR